MVRKEQKVARIQPEGLTCIPQRIHCGATPEGETLSEVDIIAVEQFLDTLADVAMAVASRRLLQGE